MTTHPSPGAREIAEKYVSLIFNETVESRDSRVTALAQAIEEYARGVMSNHWCEAHPAKPTLRHHQEDASDGQ